MLTTFSDIPERDRVIVALDCDIEEAFELADKLQGKAAWMKIGMTLFYANGPAVVYALKERGFKVFLDLKFHDIPHQVEGAAYSAAASGADMMTMHTIGGVAIHQFAYMIIFVAIVAAAGIVPDNIRAAAKKLQSFFTANLILIIMVGVGVDTNIIELAKAITPGNVVIALAIVIGAIIGSAIVGYLVGFFPIDSAITAGLCMANRGGSGDLAVLGAAKRMGLIAYAQLSSRLGGGIVLIIGSILFGAFLK